MTPALTDDHLQAAQTVWRYLSLYDPVSPADAIIGLGSWDIRVATRCAELYQAGMAPIIVFTGNEGRFTKGRFHQTEARTFADAAIAAGITAASIILEERATNTGENIRYTAALLPGAARVILVSKPHMQRRVRATARLHWPGVHTTSTAPVLKLESEATSEFPFAAIISELTGALERILTYPDLGFQTPEPVSIEVMTAHRTLIVAGYDADLP